MANTGWLSLNFSSYGSGVSSWSNLAGATSSDNVYAALFYINAGETCKYLRGLLPTNSVPVGSTILGVEVTVERKSAVNNSPLPIDAGVNLYNAGVVGDNKSNAVPWAYELDQQFTYGGAADLWGVALTDTIINSGNFGVVVRAVNNSATLGALSVDEIKIKIYYLPPINITDVGVGTESLTIQSQVTVSDTGVGTDFGGMGSLVIDDTGLGVDRLGGESSQAENATAAELILIKKFIIIEDSGVVAEVITQAVKISPEELGVGADVIGIIVYITISEVPTPIDSTDVDYNFSSVVPRFSGSAAEIKFTGYREEIS